MTALPPLPEPTLERHEYELWGQNVCSDFFTPDQMCAYAEQARADLLARVAELEKERDTYRAADEAMQSMAAEYKSERDIAINMLGQWCADVDRNGTGWDDWDENYKEARFRPGPLRELLDAAIDAAIAAKGE